MADCRLSHFLRWLGDERGIAVGNYREALAWSVDDLSAFWDATRTFFDVIGDGFTGPVLAVETMPGAVWYPRARLNFAENVLRYARIPDVADSVAVIDISEDDGPRQLTWRELESRVAALAEAMREFGIGVGDRVAAVLPNIPEAIIAMLAAASIGALWTVNSPELSARATLDRLVQIKPKMLIGIDSYRFGGKVVDCGERLAQLRTELPTVDNCVLVSHIGGIEPGGGAEWTDFDSLTSREAQPSYERVPFDHPLWVLFSSGTTGLPKGIVHGHGGITLEAWRTGALNHDTEVSDVYYVAANTSWMVWNTLVMNMVCGTTVVTYGGSPTYPRADRQFEILARTKATQFTTGAAYLTYVQQRGQVPCKDWDLTSLTQILSTGSPLPDSTWTWVHEAVKRDVHLGSVSGGTEICSSFIGSNPLEPVRLGELQGPGLGVAVEAWNDLGDRVVGDVGEMVITRPMPSMPVSFLNDVDGARYRAAYFEKFPGVWTHGDLITETPDGGFVVHGRSDATLNRFGVRFGSGDIYAALEHVSQIQDSLVVGVERPDGGYYMPLFVVLAEGCVLDDELVDRIRSDIRRYASPRHVPDDIIAAPGVPVTHTMKKAEVPVKKLLAGADPARGIARSSIANLPILDWYIDFASRRATNISSDRFSPK